MDQVVFFPNPQQPQWWYVISMTSRSIPVFARTPLPIVEETPLIAAMTEGIQETRMNRLEDQDISLMEIEDGFFENEAESSFCGEFCIDLPVYTEL